MNKELEQIRKRFVEAAGHTSQSLGAGRVIGQIFAYVYFSPDPQSLDDLTRGLGISKGSASMGVRQLDQWGALRRVWIKGDRKDYYEATDQFGRVVRRVMLETIGQRMEAADQLLDEVENDMRSARAANSASDPDWSFFKRRIKRFQAFRDRAKWLWDKVLQGILLK